MPQMRGSQRDNPSLVLWGNPHCLHGLWPLSVSRARSRRSGFNTVHQPREAHRWWRKTLLPVRAGYPFRQVPASSVYYENGGSLSHQLEPPDGRLEGSERPEPWKRMRITLEKTIKLISPAITPNQSIFLNLLVKLLSSWRCWGVKPSPWPRQAVCTVLRSGLLVNSRMREGG